MLENILIGGGIVLSFIGLVLMIKASVYIDEKGQKWDHRHNPVKWKVNLSWCFLIVGVMAQVVGIWFSQISSVFASLPAITNLPETKSMPWDAVNSIIQSQYNVAMWGVMGALVIAGIVAAVSFSYHFTFAKKAVEDVKKELEEKISTEAKRTLDQSKTEIESAFDTLKKETTDNFNKFRAQSNADIYMTWALIAKQASNHKLGVHVLVRAAIIFIEIEQISLLRTAINQLKDPLDKCQSLEQEDVELVRHMSTLLPELFSIEKKEILSRLKKIQIEKKENGN